MMIKNIKSILVITLPILLLSCGFKPIHLKNEKLINIQNISIEGERRSAYFLKNGILLISDTDSKKIYDIIIKVTKQKNNKIKNKRGATDCCVEKSYALGENVQVQSIS